MRKPDRIFHNPIAPVISTFSPRLIQAGSERWAVNGEPIGQSEMYVTSASRDHGIAAVKQYAPGATVEDLT